MPWRFVRNILNNERVIHELSQSYPIRSLARLLVRSYKNAEHHAEKKLPPITKMQGRFSQVFKEEYQKALKK